MLLVKTTLAIGVRWGSRRCVMRNDPRKFVRNTTSLPFSSANLVPDGNSPMPALWTSMSIFFSSFAHRAQNARTLSISLVSSFQQKIRRFPSDPIWATIDFTAASPFSKVRHARKTVAPCFARLVAMDRPMPLFPPVTMAIWSDRSREDGL